MKRIRSFRPSGQPCDWDTVVKRSDWLPNAAEE